MTTYAERRLVETEAFAAAANARCRHLIGREQLGLCRSCARLAQDLLAISDEAKARRKGTDVTITIPRRYVRQLKLAVLDAQKREEAKPYGPGKNSYGVSVVYDALCEAEGTALRRS